MIERYKESAIGLFGDSIHDHLEWSWKDTSLFAGEEVEEVLLALVRSIVAYDAIGFSCACLSIGEDGGIDTFEELFDGILDEVEDIFLGALGW